MNRFFTILLVLFGGSAVSAGILTVPVPYSDIQSAIDAALDFDEIVVSAGIYNENINFKGKSIIVRSTDPSDPNVAAVTVIDGSTPSDPNNASVVTFNSGEDNNSVLSGFTITGGSGTWLTIGWDLHEIYWNRCGGGIVCYNLSEPTITKNIIRDNISGEGGGIYVYGDPVNPASPSDPAVHISPVISGNTIEDNNAIAEHGYDPPDSVYELENHGDGGAIVCFQGVDPQITDNTIQNNHADFYGGGIHLRQWSNGAIENNDIIGNDSRLGAGVHVTYNSDPAIRGNTIQGNVAGGFGGGGIYVYYSSEPIIEQNLITQNTSSSGAGIAVFWESHAIIRNNLIVNNINGAGIRVKGESLVTITNNTIVGNTALFFAGGIDCITNAAVTIENNIIASNGGDYGLYASAFVPTIRNNNVWSNGAGNYSPLISDQTGINGNISEDPEFMGANDYYLSIGSPCIDAGDPNFSDVAQNDFAGRPRKLGQYVDMGAYEFPPIQNISSQGQYNTIQDAIDDANEFDVIVVPEGTHTGDGNRDIDFCGKAVTVRSTDPEDPEVVANTIIDSQGGPSNPHRGFYMHTNEDANSVINGLTITGGSRAYEGGGIYCNSSSPTITNCIIRNNLTRGNGGGIYCGWGSNPIISNCLITENSFDAYGYGAGIYCFYDSSPFIYNCIVSNNVVTGNSPPGHGRHGGGMVFWGFSEDTGCHALVVNCIVVGNTAEHRGGGLYAYWSSPTFVNCTVVGNQSYEGGGIGSFRESDPKVYNCIVRNNRATIGEQLALISTIRLWSWEEITEMTVSNSNIEGGNAEPGVFADDNMILNWLGGNIQTDPNFADIGHWDDSGTPAEPNDDTYILGNYHLVPTSSCVGAGDNVFLPGEITSDIDGEPRIYDGFIDIGADEVVLNPADFDTSGKVDPDDLLVLMIEWLDAGSELESDLYDDDFIDLADWALFAEQWLWQGGWYQE